MIPKILKIKRAVKDVLDVGEIAFEKKDGKFVSRRERHVYARQLYVYFVYNNYKKHFTLDRISFETRLNYDHGSILYCKEKINDLLSYDKYTQADVDAIERRLETQTRKDTLLLKRLHKIVNKTSQKDEIFEILKLLYGFEEHLQQSS
jgi:hypothetical protein